MKCIALIGLCVLYSVLSLGQATPTDSLHIIHADSLLGLPGNNGTAYNRLIGNVQLEQNGTILNCDSAHFYLATNYAECFGNVQVVSNNGATVNADYIEFNGTTHKAFLKGNVVIVDDDNTLHSEQLTYNTKTKIANYNNGATLQNNATTLTSNVGTYNGFTKDAYFKKDVVVTDPGYDVTSKEMKYNTKSKLVTFIDESTIITDDATIYGKKGTYDAQKEIGKFNTRSTVVTKDNQEITADKLYYDKKSGLQTANGNVNIYDNDNEQRLLCDKATYNSNTTIMIAEKNVDIEDFKEARHIKCNYAFYQKKYKYMYAEQNVWIWDSTQQTVLQCNKMQYQSQLKLSLATGLPIITMLADGDSLYIRADSFFTAPSATIDSYRTKIIPTQFVGDTTGTVNKNSKDTALTMLGIGHVRLFGDSMQALADSISYSQADSTFRLYRNPILWSNGSQATGDTIYVLTFNNKAKQIHIIGNGLLVNDTKATKLYNQIAGLVLDAYIDSNQIKQVVSDGNATSLYYQQNSNNEFEGLNRCSGASLKILFEDKKISKIVFYSEPNGKLIPFDKVVDGDKFLDGFRWEEKLRPINKQAVTNYK
jgi:lipopolysaccharide export system protein LptA